MTDWELPQGVDRGLWDYLHSEEMVRGYDAQMAASPLAATDVRFCEETFAEPGRLIDLGCGTGRLARHFAAKGYDCVGVDLSTEMLAQARANAEARSAGAAAQVGNLSFVEGNLVDLAAFPADSFDFAACLFSTLGMIRGSDNRLSCLRSAARVLKPGGRLVLHVHNRGFHGLGWKRFRSSDITMSQAYGGAPLTLHHFTRREAITLLREAGFTVTRVQPVGVTEPFARSWFIPGIRAYGYLLACTRYVAC